MTAAGGREYVLTLSCPDKPGIVYAVSSFLVQHSANILASQQYGESPDGRFFMRVHFSVLTVTPCTRRITSVASTSGRMTPACCAFASSRSVVWRIAIQHDEISSDSMPTASPVPSGVTENATSTARSSR